MRDFALTIEEVRSLRALHRSCRDRRLADRIKAIVLLGTGWPVSDTGEALMLDEETVRQYVRLYRRGTDKSLKSNTGRARVNINGAIDINHLGIVVDFAESVNAQSSLMVLRTLESKRPEAEKIYVYCDNTRHYRCSLVQEFVKQSKIGLLSLPPYSPNLNLIRRLWKYFRKQLLYNKYYEHFADFVAACRDFFERIKDHREALRTLLTENFQLIRA